MSDNTTVISLLKKQCRNRNREMSKICKIKQNHDNLIQNKVITELDNDDIKCSHTLIELSIQQWKRY